VCGYDTVTQNNPNRHICRSAHPHFTRILAHATHAQDKCQCTAHELFRADEDFKTVTINNNANVQTVNKRNTASYGVKFPRRSFKSMPASNNISQTDIQTAGSQTPRS